MGEAAGRAEEEGMCDWSEVILLKTGRSGRLGERGVVPATGILTVDDLGCLWGRLGVFGESLSDCVCFQIFLCFPWFSIGF